MSKRLYELDMTLDWNQPRVRGRRKVPYHFFSQGDPGGSNWKAMKPINDRFCFSGQEICLRFAIWGLNVKDCTEARLDFRATFKKASDAPSWQTWGSPYPESLTRSLEKGVQLDRSNLLFHFGPRALWIINTTGEELPNAEGVQDSEFWTTCLPSMKYGRYELLVTLRVRSVGPPRIFHFDPEMEVGDQELPPDHGGH